MEQSVNAGSFREDLYHRLNVIRVKVPSLRERREDVVLLAQHSLASAARELQVETKMLSEAAAQHLENLPWQGNVRQLENTAVG